MRCSGCWTGRTGSGGGCGTRAHLSSSSWVHRAVLIPDGIDFVKQAPVGRVQRQYFGTAGRTENCQAGHSGG
jgi:hypothetical protein